MITLNEFRNLVRTEFGKDLCHATPANVREFLDRLNSDILQAKIDGRIVLNESYKTYEEIIKEFFARILDEPSDEAFIMLWTMALDLSFSAIESHYADRLTNLFKDLE